jgi:hypothetical protein
MQGQICDPSSDDICSGGVPLQWRQPCISFDVAAAASDQVSWQAADDALGAAFKTWLALDCGGGKGPSIQVMDFGSVSCTTVEYNQHGGNANILIFRDQEWPHPANGGSVDTLALTTVTYDVDSGDIYDADIEVNTANFPFTTTNVTADIKDDLQSVLTHETGHFLGLAHTSVQPATMFPSYMTGDVSIRNPTADDIAAICLAYPVDRTPAGECTGIPRHGWAPQCFAEQSYLGCAVASPGPVRGGGRGGLGLGIVGIVALARHARRRGPRDALQIPKRKPRLVRKPEMETPVSRSMPKDRVGLKPKPT